MGDQFQSIVEEMTREYPEVSTGNMMSSPALTHKKKVFAFYYNHQMVFKLGEHTVTHMEKYPGSSFLSPFKRKPPMKGWLVVPSDYAGAWKALAETAFENIRN